MKKLISIALTAVMLFMIIPFSAFAESVAPESNVWDGSIATGFASGSGTEEDPFVIMTASELAYFAKTVNEGESYKSKFIKLGADIFLNDVYDEDWMENANAWTPIGKTDFPFSGSFDGGNHIVRGLYINTTEGNQGLFGVSDTDATYSAYIKNISIVDSLVIGGDFVGAVIGNASHTDITNCSSECTVDGANNIGGIAGSMNENKIIDCYNNGIISGVDCVGGVVGKMYMANAENCYNTANITASGDSIGGVFGDFFWGEMTKCYNTAKVNGNKTVGGVAGGLKMGLILDVSLCYNVGAVNGKDEVGGLFGLFEKASLSKSYNSGAVNGKKRIGGIAGVYSSGGAIVDCYNNGDVNGTENVGGISGEAVYLTNAGKMAFENIYNRGNVSGTKNVGGIVGFYGKNIPTTNCYYLKGTASVGIALCKSGWSSTMELPDSESGIVSLSDEAMNKKDSFKGFDFESVWTMDGYAEYAYPELIENPQVYVPVPAFVFGDVDNDKDVDADDYILLKRIFFGQYSLDKLDTPETALTRSDVTKDGEIDADDYILLKRVFFGQAKI